MGYYEAQPDFGGAMNRFCIEKARDGEFSVAIATAYCPSSKECMNARIDGIQFWAKLKNNQLTYSEGSGCSLKVKFGKNGATIFQSETWCGDEHPYLYAAGKYKRISSEPDRHSCRLE
ncbi:MAG: hypothetical protein IPQ22_13520 [Rhodoferax sp.]|nr:hypothetical protein [Rhodoferax sp.]